MQILYACGRSITRISECVNLDLLVMVNTFELEIQPHANGVKSLTWDIKGSSFTISSQNLVFGSELDSNQYYCNIVVFTQLPHNLLRVCLYRPIIQLGSRENVSVRLLRIPLAFVCIQKAITAGNREWYTVCQGNTNMSCMAFTPSDIGNIGNRLNTGSLKTKKIMEISS